MIIGRISEPRVRSICLCINRVPAKNRLRLRQRSRADLQVVCFTAPALTFAYFTCSLLAAIQLHQFGANTEIASTEESIVHPVTVSSLELPLQWRSLW
jgi:hypothetical protein